jgi:hypothetical protein
MTVVLNRLIFYALGTGLATSILALVSGIIWIVLPNTFISGAIIYVGTKMHVNSLLISLNSRRMMSRQLASGPVTIIGLSGSSGGIHVDQSTTHRTDRTSVSAVWSRTGPRTGLWSGPPSSPVRGPDFSGTGPVVWSSVLGAKTGPRLDRTGLLDMDIILF